MLQLRCQILKRTLFKWQLIENDSRFLSIPTIYPKSQNKDVDVILKNHPFLLSHSNSHYILDKYIAECLADIIKKKLNPNNKIIIEANPGPGILSKYLLNTVTDKLICLECKEEFFPYLQKLQNHHKDKEVNYFHYDVYKYKSEDICMKDIISKIPPNPLKNDVVASVVGVLPPNNNSLFMYNLTHLYCHQGLFTAGHIQWFLLVSASLYRQLISSDLKRKNILLELLYDVNVCCKTPVTSVYPRIPKKRMHKMTESVDASMTYLLQITPRPESRDILQPDDLLKFSLFLKQFLMRSRSTRLIPRMEDLVPGCGIYLIKEGFNMIQIVNDLSPSECLKIYKMLPLMPMYSTSSWRNYLLSEGFVLDEEEESGHGPP